MLRLTARSSNRDVLFQKPYLPSHFLHIFANVGWIRVPFGYDIDMYQYVTLSQIEQGEDHKSNTL